MVSQIFSSGCLFEFHRREDPDKLCADTRVCVYLYVCVYVCVCGAYVVLRGSRASRIFGEYVVQFREYIFVLLSLLSLC